VHIGGGVCGQILLSNETDHTVCGQGAIVVYNKAKTSLYKLMGQWADFLLKANCDKCVPCREGIYRIAEMVKKRKINRTALKQIFYAMETTSLCGLGKAALIPFRDIINKLLK
jgi:NADH:ubiquinone oxidoreductase subunit F (NADH-binding)